MNRNKLQRSIFAKRNKEYCKCIAGPMICKEINGLVVRHVSFEELKPLFIMRHESVAFGRGDKTIYWGAFCDDKIVGCVGLQEFGNVCRYKTDAVLPEYRHQGIYTLLWEAREKERKNLTSHRTTAFCTPKSLPCYIGHGFYISRTNKNITFVERHEQF